MEGVALGHDSTVWDIAFNVSGELLASVGDEGALKIWDAHLKKGGEPHFKLLATLQGQHTRSVYAVSWSTQGVIATACGASLSSALCAQCASRSAIANRTLTLNATASYTSGPRGALNVR